jgi:hypothetical protein
MDMASSNSPHLSHTEKSTKQVCCVCFEGFNMSSRKKIACPYCPAMSCSTCTRQYLLTIPSTPCCMQCRVGWNREFVDLNFPKVYINNDLKKHRENQLIEQEKAMLPETIPFVSFEARDKERHLQIANLEKSIREMRNTINVLRNESYTDRNRLYDGRRNLAETEEEKESKSFIRACPAPDCRGFLSTQWKCALCEVWVCPECHETKDGRNDANHTCNPENVETAKLLAKETKPCPKCSAVIYKIDGCDQMWCTQCHTAFSWRTGRIETTVIHNPHYYDWLRRQNNGVIPRNPLDNPCGGRRMVDTYELRRIIKSRGGDVSHDNPLLQRIYNVHRIISHMYHVELHAYRVNQAINPTTNRDLRMRYLGKQIDESEWKKLLHYREKQKDKKHAFYQIIDMFVNASQDLFGEILVQLHQPASKECDQTIEQTLKALDELRVYFNESIAIVKKRFNSNTTLGVTLFWEMEVRS